MSKTKEAMALVDQGMAPYRAAKEVKMSPSTLYVALKKRREDAMQRLECPCCGSLVSSARIKRHLLK